MGDGPAEGGQPSSSISAFQVILSGRIVRPREIDVTDEEALSVTRGVQFPVARQVSVRRVEKGLFEESIFHVRVLSG